MSATVIEPVNKELSEEDNIFKDFPLNKFYTKLNENYNNKKDSVTCNLFISNYDTREKDYIKICNQLEEILNNWDSILRVFNSESSVKWCERLNYWIHGKIKGNKYRTKIINAFYSAWDKFSTKNGCFPKKNLNIDEREFKKKKELYEFLVNYDSVNGKLGSEDTSKNDQYCNYIKNNFDLYYSMKSELNDKNVHLYNDELKDFEKKFSEEGLCSLKEKCSLRCLDLIFSTNDEKTCSVKAEKPVSSGQKIQEENQIEHEFKEKILKKLDSYKTYETFSKKSNSYKYCNYCIDIYKYEEKHEGISDFCRMFARNLSEMNGNTVKDKCEYLYYWVYENLWKIFGTNWKNIYRNPAVLELFNIGYEIINTLKIYECYYSYDEDFSFIEWKERKYLHDYFKNYEKIESIKCIHKEEQNVYCNYFKFIKELYNKHIVNCCRYYDYSDYVEYCSDHFKCDRKYYPHNLMCKFRCPVETSPNRLKKISRNTAIKSKARLSLIEKKRNMLTVSTMNDPETLFNELMNDPFNVITLVCFTILVIFCMLFVFYKFTPLRTLVHKKTRKEKIIKKSLNNGRTHKQLKYSSKPPDINPQNKRVRIAYSAG